MTKTRRQQVDSLENTRKFVLKIIKRIFQFAVEHGVLDRNVAIGLQVKVPEPEKKVLTNAEVELFLREAQILNHRFYPKSMETSAHV